MGYRLYYVVPLKNGFASLGLTDKYSAPATILKEVWDKNKVAVTSLFSNDPTTSTRRAASELDISKHRRRSVLNLGEAHSIFFFSSVELRRPNFY